MNTVQTNFAGLTVSDLATLAPELTLIITAILLSLIDLFLPKETKRHSLAFMALVGIAISIVFVVRSLNLDQAQVILDLAYRVDDFANLFKLIILVGTALVILMSIGSLTKQNVVHKGEYYYLLLPAAVGGMIMVSSGDLITLFVGLELLSITSYIMVAMNKKNGRSAEAAFKYVVQGGIASATILYGMSFLYGISGSTNITVIRQAIFEQIDSLGPLVYLSFFLLLAGLGFKIAAAPFHAWAPDVYQGAPTPISAFLAVVSKAAAIALLYKLMFNVYFFIGTDELPVSEDVTLAIQVLAAAAIIVGNVIALRQTNVKRLLAYSGVANAGYLLIPMSTVGFDSFTSVIFYLLAYLLMNIGAFAVLMSVSQTDPQNEELGSFAGLYYRAPWTAIAMVIFVISLAGIPISAGFNGKMYILFGSLQDQQYWLSAVMIVGSIISFFYYFGIVRQMFMRNHESQKVFSNAPLQIVIWLCAILTLALGIYPNLVINFVESIYSLPTDLFIQ
jgi:NADH-quinone oxidoreductase subunit N